MATANRRMDTQFMKDQWKGYALSIAVGLIMGGGTTMAVSSAKIESVKVELQADIKEVTDGADPSSDARSANDGSGN